MNPNDDKRFYCCKEKCLWLPRVIGETVPEYKNWVDCTDMSDEQFLKHITKR